VRSPRPVLAAFCAVAAVNLVGAGTGTTWLMWLTKPLLMPLLAAYLLAAGRADRLVLAALGFATAGDVALLRDGTGWFLAGMACFLAAHLCYIAAFARGGAARALRRPPLVAVPVAYAALSVAALAWMWPGLAEAGLAVPVAVYAAALATTATTAAAHGPRVAAGGALFLLSDLLIALDVSGVATPPGPPLWVMLTYALGQALIVTGWAARAQSSSASRSAASSASSSPSPSRR
jgi:uncharacterized membrane protein YhhN